MDLSDGTLILSCVTSIEETLVIDSMSVLDLTQVDSIPNSRNVYLDLFFYNFTDAHFYAQSPKYFVLILILHILRC
jgi:hypothetical protein